MTDRELLELAAKAAGMRVLPDDWPRDQDGWFYCPQHEKPAMHFRNAKNPHAYSRPWAPLTDDGDALRLVVALRLWIQISERCAWAQQDAESIVGNAAASSMVMFADVNNDPQAATRRAIVRAAAEIQRAKENNDAAR